MTYPLVVDGRNLLDSDEMAEAGFWYYPTGRPAVEPTASESDTPPAAAPSSPVEKHPVEQRPVEHRGT
jgi:hypothetical protein